MEGGRRRRKRRSGSSSADDGSDTASSASSEGDALVRLVRIARRLADATGVPEDADDDGRDVERTLEWLAERLEAVRRQLDKRANIIVLPPPRDEYGSVIVRRHERSESAGERVAIVLNESLHGADGLDGVEDVKVDSEDELPELPTRFRRARSSALALPRGMSLQNAVAAINSGVVPLVDAPSTNGGPPMVTLPSDLNLDEDGNFYSRRSSQAALEGRPPFGMPGSAGNSYLTGMSSWKSIGQGEANRLHADYNKIFNNEDNENKFTPGESAIEVAGGELYVTEPLEERWEMSRKIGEGGSATVRLAMRKEGTNGVPGKEKAAVKVIPKKGLDRYNERMVSREVFSFRLLGMAGGHENIVEVYEVCEDEKYVYIVMEYLDGGELFSRISDRGQYTERDAANLVVSMLASLSFCHRLNLTHRDVKPENFVFLKDSGQDPDVKLTDFGIAHYSEDPSALCKTLCGTPLYVAPEVLLRQPYGPGADLWSLGVIVYIMLSGRPPFDDNDIVQLVKKIKYRQVKFEGSEWVLISPEGKQFLANLLDKDASNRMTAQQALEHDWLKDNCRAATKNVLGVAQINMRSFVTRKHWKAAIQGVKAINRLLRMMSMARGLAGDAKLPAIEMVDVDAFSSRAFLHTIRRSSVAEAAVVADQLSSSSSSEDELRTGNAYDEDNRVSSRKPPLTTDDAPVFDDEDVFSPRRIPALGARRRLPLSGDDEPKSHPPTRRRPTRGPSAGPSARSNLPSVTGRVAYVQQKFEQNLKSKPPLPPPKREQPPARPPSLPAPPPDRREAYAKPIRKSVAPATDPMFDSSDEDESSGAPAPGPSQKWRLAPRTVTSPVHLVGSQYRPHGVTLDVPVTSYSHHASAPNRSGDGGVVRKMSSHARKLVGKTRSARTAPRTQTPGESPPVMLAMGEQNRRGGGAGFFRWFSRH